MKMKEWLEKPFDITSAEVVDNFFPVIEYPDPKETSAFEVSNTLRKSILSGTKNRAAYIAALLHSCSNKTSSPDKTLLAKQLGISLSLLSRWLERDSFRLTVSNFAAGTTYIQRLMKNKAVSSHLGDATLHEFWLGRQKIPVTTQRLNALFSFLSDYGYRLARNQEEDLLAYCKAHSYSEQDDAWAEALFLDRVDEIIDENSFLGLAWTPLLPSCTTQSFLPVLFSSDYEERLSSVRELSIHDILAFAVLSSQPLDYFISPDYISPYWDSICYRSDKGMIFPDSVKASHKQLLKAFVMLPVCEKDKVLMALSSYLIDAASAQAKDFPSLYLSK